MGPLWVGALLDSSIAQKQRWSALECLALEGEAEGRRGREGKAVRAVGSRRGLAIRLQPGRGRGMVAGGTGLDSRMPCALAR